MFCRPFFLFLALGFGLSAAPLRAQPATTPSPYRNLVMEGGGIRGIAYGGALLELEQRGVLRNVQRVGGRACQGI